MNSLVFYHLRLRLATCACASAPCFLPKNKFKYVKRKRGGGGGVRYDTTERGNSPAVLGGFCTVPVPPVPGYASTPVNTAVDALNALFVSIQQSVCPSTIICNKEIKDKIEVSDPHFSKYSTNEQQRSNSIF